MVLIVNGERTEIKDGITVADLLRHFDIPSERVAVEVNLSVVKKCDYERHVLNDGDRVEIVNFVGCG
jgi:thiamine biosynthesis protein ThiS